MDSRPQFDRATGNVVVAVEQPQPHQIGANMVLNAFQGLDDPTTGQYIGEFKVTAVNGNNVTLTPSYKPTAERQRLLEQPRGPWALYEVLPADMNELFAGLTEQEIKGLLPKGPQRLPGEVDDDFQARQLVHQKLVDEYTQDNKKIDAANPPEPARTAVIVKFVKDQAGLTEAAKTDLRAIDFGENLVKSGVVMKVDLKTAEELVRLELVQEVERRYQRKLRDYSYIFREFHRRRPVVEDQVANLEKDLAYMIEANKEADAHLADARKQETALNQELALVSKERDVVVQFHDTLQDRLNKVHAEIARLQAENQRLATQLAQRQLEAVAKEPRAARRESRAGNKLSTVDSVPPALNSRL
jgi:hypothetical protein